MYKLGNEIVIRLSDNMSISMVDGNSQYEEYKQWLLEGNTPEPEFTQAELDTQALSNFKAKIQTAIDDTDRTMIRS